MNEEMVEIVDPSAPDGVRLIPERRIKALRDAIDDLTERLVAFQDEGRDPREIDTSRLGHVAEDLNHEAIQADELDGAVAEMLEDGAVSNEPDRPVSPGIPIPPLVVELAMNTTQPTTVGERSSNR